jgi:cytochrome c biogenesis factor
VTNENGRTLAGVINEFKDEIKDFVQTRIYMLQSEFRDKFTAWKTALPLIVVALVLMGTAWLVLTAALTSILAVAFLPSPYAYFFAFLIVGVVYMFGGAVCAGFAIRELKEHGIMPQRTVKVLKEDKIWLQTEARTHV